MSDELSHAALGSVRERLFRLDTMAYSLQHFIFGVANAAAIPVVVGSALGLDAVEIGALAQRTFFFAGIASLTQAFFGHKYPIYEGPAGVWYTTFVLLAATAVQAGKPLELLRTDLMTGLFAAGIMTILLGVFKLMPYIRKLFTPIVNGTFLIIMSLQFSSTIARGLLTTVDGKAILSIDKLGVFFVAIGTILMLSLKAKGFIRSMAVLIGTVVGWIVAYATGVAQSLQTIAAQHQPALAFPQIFAWGRPTFDVGVTITALMAGLVVLSNLVASVSGMDELYKRKEKVSIYSKTAICTGVADILAAIGSVVGFIPYASSIGFASLTGVLDILPFIIGSVFMVFLGLIPSVGNFFAAMPITVGYAVMFSVFIMIMGMGIKDAAKEGMDTRKTVILGFSILLSNVITVLPVQAFSILPSSLIYLMANGLIIGVTIAILLEHVIFRVNLK
ncbi:xanthine permease [Desulfosporosinus fructosivorans]|uniref:Xanthine permease n=1 Tax=Desulfosporosinus fructosivorans TaxID=2018669 RepID=A0A4Z0R732_9FIRM|nr:purine/pyrimidine permease [Desulfosporosinus fructosivorans]TGE38364.1 xanthine permease [Desulfosporosinus fructosivorans]